MAPRAWHCQGSESRIATFASGVLGWSCTAAFLSVTWLCLFRWLSDGTAGITTRSYGSATASRTGVPSMHLSGSNILIVGEAPGTLELRERLIASGANVQVVSVAGASIVIRQKQIDGAFIGASLDEDTRQLCEELSALGIAQILIAPGRTTSLPAALANGVNLNGLRRKMRTPAFT